MRLGGGTSHNLHTRAPDTVGRSVHPNGMERARRVSYGTIHYAGRARVTHRCDLYRFRWSLDTIHLLVHQASRSSTGVGDQRPEPPGEADRESSFGGRTSKGRACIRSERTPQRNGFFHGSPISSRRPCFISVIPWTTCISNNWPDQNGVSSGTIEGLSDYAGNRSATKETRPSTAWSTHWRPSTF